MIRQKVNRKTVWLFVAAFLLLLVNGSYAQLLFPAKWELGASQENIGVGQEVDLIFNVELDPNWYLYSTDFDPELGPNVTTFIFEQNDSYKLVGEIQPIGAKKKYEEIWKGEYTYFKGKARFVQRVRILKEPTLVEGEYAYQVCNELDGMCISFEDTFDFADLLSQ